jgi:hypothetical protein
MGKPEGKKPLGKPMCRWKDEIIVGLKYDWTPRTRLIWLRIGTNGGGLLARY